MQIAKSDTRMTLTGLGGGELTWLCHSREARSADIYIEIPVFRRSLQGVDCTYVEPVQCCIHREDNNEVDNQADDDEGEDLHGKQACV